jgi:Na+/H+-dicarboxylate symporter
MAARPVVAGPPSMSATTRVLAALVLGLIAGALVLSYPAPALLTLVGVIEPIGTLWVNAIRMTVVPLVVSLLITGVASSGSVRTIRTLGVRSAAAFVGLLAVSASVGLIAVPWLFAALDVDRATIASFRGTQPVAAANATGFAEWIAAIVPANPIKAAADGALLPLVVFTLAFALALLTVRSDGRSLVVAFCAAIAETMLAIVRVVIALAPIGVFALMLPVASRTGLTAAGALAYYVVATAAAVAIGLVLLYPIVALAARVPLSQFARAVFPAQAVAAASSSSLASLPALVDGAERRLRLPASATGVVLPLAVSSFKLASPILWQAAAVFLARLYGVPISPTQQVSVAATAMLISFSTPGIPHGWLLGVSPLIASMGVPSEGIGLLIAVDAVPDIFATVLNVTGDMAAAAIVVRRSGSAGASAPATTGASAPATAGTSAPATAAAQATALRRDLRT